MTEQRNDTSVQEVKKPAFRAAFLFWLKLGFISFGGPAGQISIMHEFLVEKMKWISPSRFLHALNYCMLLPGPEAQQLATYTGWLLHGRKGGIIAGLFFIIPSILILLGLSILYVSLGHLPEVNALFYGLKPAVVAIVILAGIKIGSKALVSLLHYVVAILSFILIYFYDVAFPWIILGAIILGTIQFIIHKNKEEIKEDIDPEENSYVVNKYTSQKINVPNLFSFAKYILVGIILWFLPYFTLHYSLEGNSFWNDLSLFFTKAAFVTFGGAYAVLPYVAQVSVFKFQWLSELQMIDGLALGETTPGPLVMVLAFVGFMAGYNVFDSSILFGTISLLVTVWYTFLPCFFFILAGAPFIEKSRENKKLSLILGIVTAAVTGVILNLALFFTEAVVTIASGGFDFFSIVWIISSILVLKFSKIGMMSWIAISAIAGFVVSQLL